MPKVSVITPAFNSAKHIGETIDSAMNQTFQDFEFIVVDDGSTDNTREICERYLKEYKDKFFYVYQDNRGPAAARNAAIKVARGEYIALLDSDDKWLPQRLELGVRAIEESKQIGLVHANIIRISEDGKIIGAAQRNKKYLSGSFFENLLLRREHVSCPTILFRKECCDKVGLFDESRECVGVEDRDLCLRIAQHYRVHYIDQELSYYRVCKSSVSSDDKKMIDARVYIVNKLFPEGKEKYRLRNRALASIYKDRANELCVQKDFKDSKQEYQKALHYEPFAPLVWANYIKVLLRGRMKNV